ncbi:TAXI family TRAP transporter solute-binding subunit [Sporosarcina sp. G11-34]|uniref:TAXI family TRAP transporter solute-binding subunit n=1 Tax=Sporosarcina sp. G11-34 TaxID=2849605 RepID=UPI0022A9612A|nr:TAXI family TRAP transporter solute-binding subunit [Sporosarcina sp. G11-34]MCZ2257387.1 TAXI family TRAP transporter solute-binding subunit [Sporosarcina sp. G11-34]
MKKNLSFISMIIAIFLLLAACNADNDGKATNDINTGSGDKAEDSKTNGDDYADALKGEFITILSGGSSGVYFPLGGTMAKIYQDLGAKSNSQSTAASAANATTLNQGKAEIGFSMGDAAADAYEGIDSFEEQGAQENIRSVASLYTNYMQIVAIAGSGIKTIEDLKGKRVAVGAPASGTEISAKRIFAAYGMTYDDIKADYLSFSEGVEGMKNGNIDAVVISSGLPNAGVLELATSKDIVIVEIEEDKVLEMQKDYPTFFPTIVPKDVYEGMEKDANTLGVNNVLITHKDVSDDVVYAMTKALFENIDQLQNSHNAAKDIDVKKALESLPAPLHPGAKKYFDEEGVTE